MTQSADRLSSSARRNGKSSLAALASNHYVLTALSAAVFVAIWQIVSMNVSPIILPSPAKVAAAFVELTASGELIRATAQTVWPFAIGLSIAFVVGTSLGLLLGVGVLKTFIKDATAQAKMDQTIVKLSPFQGTLGFISIGVGVAFVVLNFLL